MITTLFTKFHTASVAAAVWQLIWKTNALVAPLCCR
jgi:hypothetical protein